jgi:hypothetical protein
METDSRDTGLISEENLYEIQYYKEFVMSNDKLFNFPIG